VLREECDVYSDKSDREMNVTKDRIECKTSEEGNSIKESCIESKDCSYR
jgi:hypothetical protein